MKIIEDGPAEAGAHTFTVEMERVDEPENTHALVRCEGGKTDAAVLRDALARFNVPPDDGWCWTTDALAAHLLHDLCGIALVGFRNLPDDEA